MKEKKKPENENVGGKRSCIDLTADQDETEKADQAASAAKKSKLGPASDEGWMDTIESHFECVICKDFLVKTTAIVVRRIPLLFKYLSYSIFFFRFAFTRSSPVATLLAETALSSG